MTYPMSAAQRRAVEEAYANSEGPFRDIELTETAMAILRENLTRYGSTLSPQHETALFTILGRFTHLANGFKEGRYAYDLPCGGGKTQAVVAWCAALHRLAKPYSVIVSASKVEALCDVKRDLLALGVPEAMIGLLHSYKHSPQHEDEARRGVAPDGYASMPATEDNESRQVLLVTHNRMRGLGTLDQYLYRDRTRDLVVWDESLIVSQHQAIEMVAVDAGRRGLPAYFKVARDGALAEAAQYLDTAYEALESELNAQKHEGRKPHSVSLPPLSPATLETYMRAVKGKNGEAALQAFLSLSQFPLRVVNVNQGGGGLIKYDIVVPPCFRNIAVLDASWPIRDLGQMDTTIQQDATYRKIGNVKRYPAVTVRHLKSSAGRDSMSKAFKAKREDRKLSAEIVEVVRSIPADEAVMLWTFKPRYERGQRGRPFDMAAVLRGDLEAAGIDTQAKLPDGRDRFVWLTWGQETSISEYQFVANMIFAGVLHRAAVELSGAILGQRDELLGDLTEADVRKVTISEVVHCLYQAMNRGACRRTVNGEAAPMKAWLTYPTDEVRGPLCEIMPGITWKAWDGRHVVAKGKGTKTDATAQAIVTYLADLPAETRSVSARAVRKVADAHGLSPTVWKKARNVALAVASGWRLDGAAFVRT